MKLDANKVYLILRSASALFYSVIFTLNMVYQISVAGLTPLQLVLVGTALEAAVFVFEMPTGIVADVYSRRISIIIGFLIIGLGFILEGLFPIFWVIVTGNVLWGLGYTFTSGATQAWITDEIGEEAAGQAFLRGSQAAKFGALVGILMSVVLGSVQVNIPIVFGGGMFMILGVFLIFVMPEDGFQPTPNTERTTFGNIANTFRSGLGMLNRRPILFTILLIGLFYGLYSEGYDRLWTKHLIDNFSFPKVNGLKQVAWFGIIDASEMILGIGLLEWVRRKIDTNDKKSITRTLLVSSLILVLSLLLFSQAVNFSLAILMIWAVGLSRSVIGPVYETWINQRLDSRVRATFLSMSGQVDAIGQISGGPFLGLIGNRVSVQAAIATSGMVLAPVLALIARANKIQDTSSVGELQTD